MAWPSSERASKVSGKTLLAQHPSGERGTERVQMIGIAKQRRMLLVGEGGAEIDVTRTMPARDHRKEAVRLGEQRLLPSKPQILEADGRPNQAGRDAGTG